MHSQEKFRNSNHKDMLDNHQVNEDLKAFERRLTEILACYQPQTKRWRIILLIVTLSTSITAFNWLFDPETEKVPFVESLQNHIYFTFNCIVLIVLFMSGIHKRVVAPTIIVSRIKSVLENFNMSCDQDGHLILKRSPTMPSSSSASSMLSSSSSLSTASAAGTITTTISRSPPNKAYNGHVMQSLQAIGRT
jgi:hypothetical protein